MPKTAPESLLSRLMGIRRERENHVAESDAEARQRLQTLAIAEAAGDASADAAAELDVLLDKLGESPETFAQMVADVQSVVAAGAAARRAESFLDGYRDRFEQAVREMREANDARNAASRRVHGMEAKNSAARRSIAAWATARRANPALADDDRVQRLIAEVADG